MGAKQIVAGALALALAIGWAAGCGSSSNTTTVTTTAVATISKSEFLAKGNLICTKGNQRTDAVARKTLTDKQPTQAQSTAFGKAQIPIIQRQIDQIRALGAPPGDEATVNQMLALAQGDLDKIKASPAVAANIRTDLFANFAKVAHPYGLTACAAG